MYNEGMKPILMVALVGGALFAWTQSNKWRSVPSTVALAQVGELGDGGDDPCHGKERCVLVYMAPWCPACKSLLPQLLNVRDGRWKDSTTRGFKFVVGHGSPEQNREMVKQIGRGAYLDDDKEFSKKMGVRHFPTLYVLDGNGRVIESDRAALDWLNRDLGSAK